jgi:hypothetical protein
MFTHPPPLNRPRTPFRPSFAAIAAPTAAESQFTTNEPIPTTHEEQLVAYLSPDGKKNVEAKPTTRNEHASEASTDLRSAFPRLFGNGTSHLDIRTTEMYSTLPTVQAV